MKLDCSTPWSKPGHNTSKETQRPKRWDPADTVERRNVEEQGPQQQKRVWQTWATRKPNGPRSFLCDGRRTDIDRTSRPTNLAAALHEISSRIIAKAPRSGNREKMSEDLTGDQPQTLPVPTSRRRQSLISRTMDASHQS